MQDIIIDRRDVNIPALDEELRTTLGGKIVGVSSGPKGVTVHLQGASGDDVALAMQIAEQHDSTTLTAEQQAEADEKTALEIARSMNTTVLDVTDYANTAAEIQTLARKVAWLEKEINVLQRS